MGERLREARTARRLSLRKLAERLGVSPSLISQIETGRAEPSVSTLYAIAAELDVSLDEPLFNDRRAAEGGLRRPGGGGGDDGRRRRFSAPRPPAIGSRRGSTGSA